MASISYHKLWETKVCNNVSAKRRVQNTNLNQLNLKVNDPYKNDRTIATHFETSDPQDVITKLFIEAKLSKKECLLSFIEREYNEFKHFGISNKQSDD